MVRREARSDPASGSEKPWHQKALPWEMGGRKRAFCSSVPYSMIVGPTQFTFMYCELRGSPRCHISSPTIA